jgi:iron complex transport system substrate-binding protein
MMTVTDHLERQITLEEGPQRIISLCPAITETLLTLGANVVGRTKYCIFPKDTVASIPTVGGTKQIDLEAIETLAPTIIICEKEENTKDIVTSLENRWPTFVCEVNSVDTAYRMIHTVGQLANCDTAATALVENIQQAFQALPTFNGRVAYMMWRKPYMAVGDTTYINDLLKTLGFANPIAELEGRYPAVTLAQLADAKLDYVLLSSEPFPFSEKHIEEFQPALPKARILFVDGEMFWYGARMLDAARYFKQLIF